MVLVVVEAFGTCLLEMVTLSLDRDRNRRDVALLLSGCLVFLTHSLAGLGREVSRMLYQMKLLKSLVALWMKLVGNIWLSSFVKKNEVGAK